MRERKKRLPPFDVNIYLMISHQEEKVDEILIMRNGNSEKSYKLCHLDGKFN